MYYYPNSQNKVVPILLHTDLIVGNHCWGFSFSRGCGGGNGRNSAKRSNEEFVVQSAICTTNFFHVCFPLNFYVSADLYFLLTPQTKGKPSGACKPRRLIWKQDDCGPGGEERSSSSSAACRATSAARACDHTRTQKRDAEAALAVTSCPLNPAGMQPTLLNSMTGVAGSVHLLRCAELPQAALVCAY